MSDPVIATLPDPVRTVEQGARPVTYLAGSRAVTYVSGWYFADADEPRLSAPESYHPDAARRLWERSAELVNLRRGERPPR